MKKVKMITNSRQTIRNHIFHEITRSLCPECRRLVDAQVLIRDGAIYLRKHCPEHGWHEALVSSDANWYLGSLKYNKPGAIPHKFATSVEHGCPSDCGLCPEHQQHTCVSIIEITTRCNLACPICFADAGSGYQLSVEQFFMIQAHGFMDEHTFDVKRLMKCCFHELLPDGRAIPFCAYNNLGYREQVKLSEEAQHDRREE